MGLIKAALGAAGGVMADQWKEYFYCDALEDDVLVMKGQKRTSKRSSNRMILWIVTLLSWLMPSGMLRLLIR